MTAASSRAARTHAGRTWTCACGRVCRGNGGRSSHQRACLTYKRDRLDRLAKVLHDIALGTWPHRASGMSDDLTQKYRHQYGLDYVRLRREIAEETGEDADTLVDVADLVLPHHRRAVALALHERSDGTVTLPDAVRFTELVLDTVARLADGG